jgi:hypothetical protein
MQRRVSTVAGLALASVSGGSDATSSIASNGVGEENEWVTKQEKEINSLPPLSKYCTTDNHQKVLELTLVQVLRTMGLSETHVQSTLESVRENSSIPSRYLLDVSVQRSFSSLALNVIAPYLQEQVYISKIIKTQARVRGWYVRGITQKYQNIYKPLGLDTRLQLFRDFITFQRTFISDLHSFTSIFHDALLKHSEGKGLTVSDEEMSGLFGNFPHLLKFNQSIYAELLRFREREWPFIDGFSSVFYNFRSNMTEYSQTALNFQYQKDTFERLLLKPKFITILESCLTRNHISKFAKLFDRAVNWVKDLLRLLEEYEQTLPPASLIRNQICGLKELVAVLKQYKVKIEENFSFSAENARIRNVLRRVTPSNFSLEDTLLNDPERRYLREGDVVLLDLNGKKRKRYLFFFSDLILFTKSVGDDIYTIQPNDVFSFDHATLTENEIAELVPGVKAKDKEAPQKCFTLQRENARFHVMCNLEAELFIWIAKITQQIRSNQLVFGVPLDEVITREASSHGIPLLMYHSIQALEEKGMYSPDLFSRAGNAHTLKTLKKLIDRGKVVTFTDYDPYVVANLLEDYLLALPEPLLTQQFCDALGSLNLESVKFVEMMRSNIPKNNLRVIEYLVMFLLRLCPIPGSNLSVEALYIRFQTVFFRSKYDPFFTKADQQKHSETITIKLFRSYYNLCSAFGLIYQANESANCFINTQGRARCSPSFTKFPSRKGVAPASVDGFLGKGKTLVNMKRRTTRKVG